MAESCSSATLGTQRRVRGVHLNTLMILIAVAAVGFTAATLNPERLLERIDFALPCLALATLVLVVLRLRPPRPPITRLASQPGFLACGVASVLLIGAGFGSFLLSLIWRMAYGATASGSVSMVVGMLFQSLTDWGYLIGFAVIVAWIVLGAVRGWRAEPDRFDRVGRVIGWAWIVLAPAAIALRFMVLLGSMIF